jgi:alpha-galactosidase
MSGLRGSGSSVATTSKTLAIARAQEQFKLFDTPVPILPKDLIANLDFTGLGAVSTVLNKCRTASRLNLMGAQHSEPKTMDQYDPSGLVTAGTMSLFDNALHVARAVSPSTTESHISLVPSISLSEASYTLSFYMQMDDNSKPRAGARHNANTDFYIWWNPDVIIDATVSANPLPGTYIYRVTCTTASVHETNQICIAKEYNDSATGFTVSGFQINAGSSATDYEETPYFDATLVNTPTILETGVEFNGTDERAVIGCGHLFPLAGPSTIILVVKTLNTASDRYVLSLANWTIGQGGASSIKVSDALGVFYLDINNQGNSTDYVNSQFTRGQPCMMAMTVDSENVALNHITAANLNSASPYYGNICLSYLGFNTSTKFAHCVINYLLAFDRVLSRDEIRQVWAYLKQYLGPKGIDLTDSEPPPYLSLSDVAATVKPPLGWGSWNFMAGEPAWGGDTGIKAQIDAIQESGLLAAGYMGIEPDDYIFSDARDENGFPLVNKTGFPTVEGVDGYTIMSSYIHAHGFKLFYYAAPGETTIGGVSIGSYGYEHQDAAFAAKHHAAYTKYDGSATGQVSSDVYYKRYFIWGIEWLKAAYRKWVTAWRTVMPEAIHQISTGGKDVQSWGRSVGGSGARFAVDVVVQGDSGDQTGSPSSPQGYHVADWVSAERCMFGDYISDSLHVSIDLNSLVQYTGNGYWNDPDYLTVGYLYDAEARSQMAMFALLRASMLMSHDVTTQSATTLATLTNSEIIAINQDAMLWQGFRAQQSGSGTDYKDVWARPLANGDWAIGFFNRNAAAAQDVAISWAAIDAAVDTLISAYPSLADETTTQPVAFPTFASATPPTSTWLDLMAVGAYAGCVIDHTTLVGGVAGVTAKSVPAHGCALIRVTP